MPLKVTRPRKPHETRYIDYVEELLCFKVSHTFNEELIAAFVAQFPSEDIKCIQPQEDRRGNVGRRWWRVKSTAKNCLTLLRWGLQNDYEFKRHALARLTEVSDKVHEKKLAEEMGAAPTGPKNGPSI